MRRKKKAATAVAGMRVGKKRSDMRWMDPEGEIWASKFEYGVYAALKSSGVSVRRCGKSDSLSYQSKVTSGRCQTCSSTDVVTERTYTPDLFVVPHNRDPEDGYYVEAKGYLRSERRTLLRSFRKTRPTTRLRMVVMRDYPVGKGTLTEWVTKYLKIPVHIWNGKLPEDWT